MTKKQPMTIRQYLRAMLKVGRRSFRMAPSIVIVKLFDSVIQAVLPIATAYFAAATTTALAAAYAGEEQASQKAIFYVIITAFIGLFMLLWRSVSNYISQKMRYSVDASIEDEMTLKLTTLPFSSYDDKDVMELHEKARRFSYFFSYIFDTLSSMLTSIIGAITAIVALLIISPWLSLVVLVASVPGMIIQLRLARQQVKHWEGNITNRRRKGNIGWTLQQPRYISEMRVYGVVKHLIHTYATLRDKDDKERLEFELRTIWKQLTADVGTALVELGSLVWITLEIIHRQQPIGQFVYVQQMVSRAFSEAKELASQLGRIDEDLANITQYQQFMELESGDETGVSIKELAKSIKVDQVSFAYPETDVLVLDNVSMTIERGSRVAIVGENGAGKSTLIKLLMGMYQPTKGQILVDERNLLEIKKSSWHSRIALLGQSFVEYAFATMRENITLGNVHKKPTDEAVVEAMKAAEFMEVADKQPHGADTYVERWMAEDDDKTTATELSGGQSQRLALARNFYRDAPIMILDEPTSAIDALAESRIFKRLFRQTGKTLIIVSHRLTTVEKADVIYMMERGKVVERGTHEELVAKRGRYYNMFESQINK